MIQFSALVCPSCGGPLVRCGPASYACSAAAYNRSLCSGPPEYTAAELVAAIRAAGGAIRPSCGPQEAWAEDQAELEL